MLAEEGLENVLARHRRHAEATRLAVRAWGLEVLCQDPARYSSSLTAVLVGAGNDADEVRRVALERYDLSLGAGLGRLAGRVFRIGHLGALNDLMLAGTLCGIELSLARAGVGTGRGGVDARSALARHLHAETEAAPLMPAAALPTPPSPGRGRRRQAGRRAGRQRGGRARWCRSAGAHRAYRAASRSG